MPRCQLSTNASGVKPQIGIYSGTLEKGVTGQFEFDVSSFRDPTGQKQFTGKTGAHQEVVDWVKADRRVQVVVKECLLLADDLLKKKGTTEKPIDSVSVWMSVAFKDHHGKWIAPAVAEAVANELSDAGYMVVVYHQHLKETHAGT